MVEPELALGAWLDLELGGSLGIGGGCPGFSGKRAAMSLSRDPRCKGSFGNPELATGLARCMRGERADLLSEQLPAIPGQRAFSVHLLEYLFL